MRIKTFSDGSFLEFDQGSFDPWCVYLTTKDGARRPPKDTDYFQFLRVMAPRYGAWRIYRDFVWIYDRTGRETDPAMLAGITELAGTYTGRELGFDKVFTVLYLAMIAEENKANSRLGRRIKRLGLHVLLFEGAGVDQAANFMKGMKWKQIDALCRQRGF